MLTVRWTFEAKPGHTRDMIDWLKSWTEYGFPIPPHGWRISSTSYFSPRYRVISEMEFESLAEIEVWWKEFGAAPRVSEAFERLAEISEGGGSELWSMEVLK